jgi:hypothetical protein
VLDRINLGKAADFAILTKSGVTTTPGSRIIGNMGTSPIAETAITGFGLVRDSTNTFSKSSGDSTVTGKVYAASHAAPTPAYMTAAVGNMESAYADATARAYPSYIELNGGNLNGLTLEPGLYKWSSGLSLSTSVTFEGCADEIWILQISGSITVASGGVGSGAKVILEGGCLAENIFWQVAESVDVGSYAHLEGIFLVKTGMTFKAGASLNGAALAQTAVTLISNTIAKSSI